MEKITSTANSRIKEILSLARSRERHVKNLIVIEGFREINMAYNAGFTLTEIYYTTEVNLHPQAFSIINKISAKTEVSRKVFEKIAYRENSDGLIALAEPKYYTTDDITISANPLLLILESVEKPGNLGALLRTADAAKLDALLICDPQTDLYNPNVIRSSLGCIFTKQVVVCSTADAIKFLKRMKITSYAAALTASGYYHNADFTKPSAIIMGSESDGLSKQWLENADKQIKIPMLGIADSLNVSASAAVIIYEAMRQRNFI
jgi:TrmH family RNA methyltransferase